MGYPSSKASLNHHPKMGAQPKKESTANSLRRSGMDFPYDKDLPLVKNNKVNAQLAPIEYNTLNVGSVYGTGAGLPPPLSREELMNLEKNHKNVSIENLLSNEVLTKGGKNQLAPLQHNQKRKM